MKHDPVTGPIPREKFSEIADLPFGKARDEIRKYDPLWGRSPGEKIKWRVKYTRTAYETGFAVVEAETEKEAEKLAEDLPDDKISWDFDDCDMSEIESIEPAK